ncbi:Fasciclin-like arabinogalactan protein 4 [Apostasia shenzhenica]|uniref:Fasciclin-like arabinogalactan protein 4 n=1 Tax=Apostasia shenzhenica TaxID=1088818 RepID=A0A2I0A8T6_9ASPA|nr:Fasciclin-like arabinogalactan protein 4 [Apostasia shenzhenica]
MASLPASDHHFPDAHFNPALLLIFLLLATADPAATAVEVAKLLAGYPDLSDFSRLLASSSVAGELDSRSSLTLLAVPNSFLSRSNAVRSTGVAGGDIADVLRYHVLLEYLSWTDLRRIPAAGKLVTTLYQTTGRAPGNLGAVNLTRDPAGGSITARSPGPFSPSNATFLSLVETIPYNVSVFSVNALLMPYGFDLAASETRPPPVLNITNVLIDGRDFNVAASMLEASGVVEEFERDEKGAGITVFVPTDEAFAESPATERIQSLPAEMKASVLRFHVLHSYYPLGSLESIVNPVQPTLATESTEAGRFTLNITRVNGSVVIDSSVVQATITRTVYDQNPVAIFAVSRVLLPREMFGRGTRPPDKVSAPMSTAAAAPSPTDAPAPDGTGMGESQPTRLTMPPGVQEIPSASRMGFRSGCCGALICTGLLYLLLLLV